MSDLYQSLSHSKWDCQYHVVFVPQRRRKALFGQTRRQLGPIFHALAKQKECQIIEGQLMPDPVHMCIAIPPKHPPVASVGGFGDRVSEGQECHRGGPAVRQGTELYGRALLGPWVRRFHGRI